MLMWKKNKQIRDRIQRYLETAQDVLSDFRMHLNYYFEHGLDTHFNDLTHELHLKESKADDIRRDIELDLYAQSLLPESREDIFNLLERIDMVPNQSEDILRNLYIQKVSVPEFLHASMLELADVAAEAFQAVVEGVIDVLGKAERVEAINRKIDRCESLGDQLEMRMIEQIFQSDVADFDKILLRDTVRAVGLLCDLSDDVSLVLSIFSVKRRI